MKKFIYESKVYNKDILKVYWKDKNSLHFILEAKEFIIPLQSTKLAEVYERFDERIGKDEDFNLDEIIN